MKRWPRLLGAASRFAHSPYIRRNPATAARRPSIISLYVGKNGLGTLGTRPPCLGPCPGTRARPPARRRSGRAWRRIKLLQRVLGILVAVLIIFSIESDPAAACN